jgi:hypothetical protein
VNRQVQLFLTPTDEESFLSALRSHMADVEVVDGQRWPSPAAPVKSRMADCTSNDVYLWNRLAAPQLPSGPRPGGGFQGPTTGVVIQWIRCRKEGTSLMSGRFAVGASDPQIIAFVHEVWRLLRSFTRSDLQTLTGEAAAEFLIGPDARRWFEHDEDARLRERNTETYFVTPKAKGPRGWIPS